MLRYLFKINFLIFIFAFIFAQSFKAQANVCNLHLKTYSYNAASPKNGVGKVNVTLTNLKTKEEKTLTSLSFASVFENLSEGNYRVVVSKDGYKKREKKFKFDCEFADENNIFAESLYLWQDKSNSGVGNDLIEDISVSKKADKANSETITQSEKPKAVRPTGKVVVNITIDEDGNVISARATSGNSVLSELAVKAVRQSKFTPTLLAGEAVQVTGDIIYNFVDK